MENLGCTIVEQTFCEKLEPYYFDLLISSTGNVRFDADHRFREGRDTDQSYPSYVRLLSASGPASKRRY